MPKTRSLPIPNYDESKYHVNEHGEIFSYARGLGTVLRTYPSGSGYPSVYLWIGNRRIFIAVHRLVAHKFIGPRPDGAVIMHLDGNRANSAASNLAYDSQSANVSHWHRTRAK